MIRLLRPIYINIIGPMFTRQGPAVPRSRSTGMERSLMPDSGPGKALFAIAGVLLLVSCGLVVLYARERPEFKEEPQPDPDQANEVLDAVLTSEISSVTYIDGRGTSHVYHNMTVAKVILMDIGLRDAGGVSLNKTSLAIEVESRIKEQVQDEVGTRPFSLYMVHGLQTITISGSGGAERGVESAPVTLTDPEDGSDVTVSLILG